jgi:lipopolysaccharide export system permease protein
MSILDRYIIRSILGAALLVIFVLLVLGALFVFIDQQGDIGVGHYTVLGALSFTLLNVPQQAFDLLPIAALMGSLLGLGSLARGSEVTVIRASGLSIARICGTVLMAGIVLIGMEVLLGEFLAPPLREAAKEQKAFSKFNDISFGGGGAWVRDGNTILNVARQSGERQFGGMQVFELSADHHHLLSIGHAGRATAGTNRHWTLSDYAESRFSNDDSVVAVPSGQRSLVSNLTAGFLGLAVDTPDQLTSRSLWSLIQYLKSNSLDAREYVFAFWSRIARTVAIAFAVLLAVPFILGSLRSAGTGARMMLAVVIGLCFFLLQKLIESGTLVFNLDPVILAWLPTALLATVTLLLLVRAR